MNVTTTGSEATRLKAAMWVLDKVEAITVGETDLRRAIERECRMEDNTGNLLWFDEEGYRSKLEEVGLSDE